MGRYKLPPGESAFEVYEDKIITLLSHGLLYKEIASRLVEPAFWLDVSNHFWESPRYTEKAKEYFRKYIVEVARKEIEKKS